MKDFWSVIRIALSVMALPLLATAAVSALNNNDGSSIVPDNVLALRAIHANSQDSSFRHHTVSVDPNGVVRGRIARADESGKMVGQNEMKVYFIQAGSVVSQDYTGPDGSFEIFGIKEGNYSFVASGPKGFAAFGVRATSDENSTTNNLIEVETISPQYDRLLEIVKGRVPTKVAVSETDPGFAPAPGGNRVELVNGNLKGQLTSLVGNVRNGEVFLIKDQTIVATGKTSDDGRFSFAGIEPGVYEFVATASSGFAALSFEAGSNTDAILSAVTPSDEYQTVSTVPVEMETGRTGAYQESLDVALVMPEDYVSAYQSIETADESVIVTEEVLPAQSSFVGNEIGYGVAQGANCGATGDWGGYSGCGSCGGGGGGGGGGIGGLGGLAGLARAAILGWVLVELFDNIDFSNDNSTPPATPSDT